MPSLPLFTRRAAIRVGICWSAHARRVDGAKRRIRHMILSKAQFGRRPALNAGTHSVGQGVASVKHRRRATICALPTERSRTVSPSTYSL